MNTLETSVREMAEAIAAAPAVTVRMAREVIRHLALPQLRAARGEERLSEFTGS